MDPNDMNQVMRSLGRGRTESGDNSGPIMYIHVYSGHVKIIVKTGDTILCQFRAEAGEVVEIFITED